jgi:hypothetical protein
MQFLFEVNRASFPDGKYHHQSLGLNYEVNNGEMFRITYYIQCVKADENITNSNK